MSEQIATKLLPVIFHLQCLVSSLAGVKSITSFASYVLCPASRPAFERRTRVLDQGQRNKRQTSLLGSVKPLLLSLVAP